MRQSQSLLALFGLAATASAQQLCSLNAEGKPSMSWQTCTAAGSCTTSTTPVVIDSNWRWAHALTSTTNCYTGNTWNATLCPSNAACAANCCIDGSGGYQSTYGVSASGSALTLDFITTTQYATNVGSRTYLQASDTAYQMFDLVGKEFTFDVDVSKLPCGLNGAVYFVSMDADGGLAKYSGNKAGAKYGTGYCDTQCAMDLKWINGAGNVVGWSPDSNDPNSGVGQMGSCCNEIDIWEANSMSTALTLHSCENTAQHECTGSTCGGTYAANRYGSDCDPDGCDLNPYRTGNTNFYGPGMTVDTTKPVTVVTQFLTDSSGTLNEVKRYYVQNGVLIPTPNAQNIAGYTGNSITEAYCKAELPAYGETDHFDADGSFASIQTGLANGMVLVMSLWDDHFANMLWLDSTYPTTSTGPGAARGSCATTSGVPATVEAQSGIQVIYSNIKYGAINSTFSYTSVLGGGTASPPPPPPPPSGGSTTTTHTTTTGHTTTTTTHTTTTTTHTTTAPPSGGATQSHWGQCGGIGYNGATNCGSYSCSTLNAYYAQCL